MVVVVVVENEYWCARVEGATVYSN